MKRGILVALVSIAAIVGWATIIILPSVLASHPEGSHGTGGSSLYSAVDDNQGSCATGTGISFNGMPNMTVIFTLGGSTAQRVIVLFSGSFTQFGGATTTVALYIDGVKQDSFGGAGAVSLFDLPSGDYRAVTYQFLSSILSPGSHVAKIKWNKVGGTSVCVVRKIMTVLYR